ncbi:MAG: tandem-95 repeat protein [Thiotrichales bacterium]
MSKKSRRHNKELARPAIEELEPRILYSADLLPVDAAVPAALHESLPESASTDSHSVQGAYPLAAEASDTSTSPLGNILIVDESSQQRHELVIIDSSVPDYQTLVDGIRQSQAEDTQLDIILLDSETASIQQVSNLFAQYKDLSAVHLISHGSDAQIQLGESIIDARTLADNQKIFAAWGDAFSTDGDFLIYGCNLAATDDGKALVDSLAELTGADVAASDDLTGDAAQGGDWELEYRQGAIESAVVFSDALGLNWNQTLDLSTGLVGHWTGDVDASDSSTNAANGAFVGNAAVDTNTSTNQVGEGKFSFDGTGDYVNLNAAASNITNLSEGSVSVWVKTTDNSNSPHAIFSLSDKSDTNSYSSVGIYQGKVFFDIAEKGKYAIWLDTTVNVADGNWHHIAVTVDAGGNKIYVDGTQLTGGQLSYSNGNTATTSFFNTVNGVDTVAIGGVTRGKTLEWDFNGLVDDLRVYNRGLNATEISQLYNFQKAPTNILLSQSTQVAITNAGFETQPVTDDNVISNTVTGWVASSSDGRIGVWNPPTYMYPAEAPEGQNVAYIDTSPGGRTLSQTLSDTFEANRSYTLSAWVGDESPAGDSNGWKMELYAGTQLLGSVSNADYNPTDGEFVKATLYLDADTLATYSANYGDALEIKLSNIDVGSTANVHFDDVQLEYTYLNVADSAANGTIVGDVASVSDPNSGDTFTYSLFDDAGGRFAIHTNTGIITVADGSLLDYATNSSHAITVRATDQTGLTYDEVFTVQVRPPINSLPASASVNEDSSIVFSTVNGNLVSVQSDNPASTPMDVTLSVSHGALTLSQTTGLTFVTGDGTADASMRITGTLANINAALDGLSYTPTANYNGAESLQISSWDDAGLLGYYSFDNTGNLGADTGPGTANNGTVTGATSLADATHGNVLNLSATADEVRVNSLLGQPSNVTLAAWVNMDPSATTPGDVISLGDAIALRVDDYGGKGVTAFYYDGSNWQEFTSNIDIKGTGWHHVAFTFDDAANTQKLYIDGVEQASGAFTTSISYTSPAIAGGTLADTTLGRHADPDEAGFTLKGQLDDARIYDRALTATEIQNIMAAPMDASTDSVAITVNAVNDAPSLSALSQDPTYTENGAAVGLYTFVNPNVFDSGEGQTIEEVKFTVTNVTDGTAEQIVLDGSTFSLSDLTNGTTATNGYGYAVSLSGTTATVTLTTTGASTTAISNLLISLSYQNASDAPTTSNRVFTITSIKDSGGTANGGVDTANPNLVSTVTVVAVNDAPVGVSASLFPHINEDDVNSAGKLVSDFTASTTDADAGAVYGIAVVETNTANGSWQYTLDGANWQDIGTVSTSSARLLPSDATTRVRFVPNTDFNGTVFPFKYIAWDQTSGSAGGLADTTTNGGTTAFGASAASVSITVDAVNDAPVANADSVNFSTEVAALNPLGYWRLGESSGTTAADASSTANSGTYHGTTLGQPGALASDSDASVHFNGSSDYVEIAHDPAYLIDEGTVLAWFKVDALGSAQTILSKDSSDFDTGGHMNIEIQADGTLSVRQQSVDADYFATSTQTVTAGQWHLLGYSFGAQGMSVYLDGDLIAANGYTGGLGASSGGTGNLEPMVIGASTRASGNLVATPLQRYFAGDIDEVLLIGSQLSNADIKALFGAGSQNYQVTEDGALNVATASGLLINDYDADGDTLTVNTTPVTNASNGALTLNADGSFTYTPDANFSGTDSFVYEISDGNGGTAQAIATITVVSTQDPPNAVDDRPSLAFDGVDDFVQVADSPALTMSTTMTMEAWFNLDAGSNSEYMVLNKEGEYEFAVKNGTLQWAFANTDPGWSWYDTGYAVAAGDWTHAAISYNNGVIKTYVNGALVDTYNGSGTIGDALASYDELRIGGRTNNPSGKYFDGYIADVRVWNTVRTDAEILANYNLTLAGSETGLAGNWLLNDGSGTTATDQSSEANHGLLGGGSAAQEPGWQGYFLNEDGSLTVSAAQGVLNNDFDVDGDSLSVNTTPVTNVSNGALTLNADGSFSYTPGQDFNGVDSFTYEISDGNGGSDSAVVYLNIAAVNDIPIINNLQGDNLAYLEGSGPLIIDQGTLASITDIDSTDFDTGTVTMSIISGLNAGEDILAIRNQGSGAGQIGVSGSNVTYEGTVIGTVSGGASGSDLTITLNANADSTATAALLANITYENSNTSAPDTASRHIEFVLADGDGGASSAVIATIDVGADNDPPVVTLPGPTVAYTENDAATLIDASATVNDVDSLDFYNGAMSIGFTAGGTSNDTLAIRNEGTAAGQVGVSGSTISYGGVAVASFSGGNAGSNLSISFNANSSPAAAQAILRNLTYVNGSDNPSTALRTIGVTLQDGDGGTSAQATIDISMTAVNDAPVLVTPLSQSVTEETASSVSGLSLSDVDANSGLLTVRLQVSQGVVNATLSGATTLSAGANNSADLTLKGSVSDLNNTLATLTYTGNTDVTGIGADSLAITVDDQGNSGTGTALQDTATVQIDISAVNDAPVNTVPASITVTEDVASPLTGIAIADVDAGSASMLVTLSVPTGTLAATSGAGVTVGGTASDLTLSGSVADINAFIASSNVTYTTAANANGSVALTVQTSDQGNTGSGGALTDSDTVTLAITAVNDAPVIATNTGVTVAEGSTGTVITTAMLNEGDVDDSGAGLTYTVTTIPANGTLYLSGVALNNNDVFTQDDIDNNRVTYDHDGSQTSADSFAFSLADGGEDGAVAATGTFNITVTNVNDAPVNTVPGAQSVNEDTALAIAGISVADADDNLSTVQLTVSNGVLNVTLSGAASISAGSNGSADLTLSGSLADINATLGSLSYQGNLNFNGSDTLTVLSTDASGATDSDTVAITINAVNDEQSLDTNAGLTLNEGATASITSAMLATTDVDNTPAEISYSVTTLPGNGQLELTTASGVAINSFTQDDIDNNRLVYVHNGTETTTDSFDFTVNDLAGTSSSGTFNITVTLVNDNAPVITASQSFSISELAANNTSLGNVAATDADTATTLSAWTITAGNTDGIFAIDPASGELTIADSTHLDFDTTPSYTLSLTVSDGTNTSAVETVSITVTDVATAITAAQSFTIAENVSNTDPVGTVVTTGDTPKTFSIIGGNVGGAFTIDNAGNITVADSSAIDYETLTSYTLTVQASDGTTPVSETVGVTITDINESTIGALSDSDAALDAVAEDAGIGDTVGITALATDPDGTDTVTYSLSDDAGGLFKIDPNSGVVTVNAALDAETATSHSIRVLATSTDASTSSQSYTITINDVDEFDVGVVTDSDVAANTVAENAGVGDTVGITASASDADVDDNITYSLSDDAGGLFTIDSATGVVTVASALDYETATSHNITLLATSDDTSTSSQVFTITVSDVNDNAPVITAAQSFSISELAANNTSLGNVAATDADTATTLSAWTITAGNTDGIFAIDPASGELTIADNTHLDFDTTPSYTLSLTVSDGTNTSAVETVVVSVADENDNAPVISAEQQFSVNESAASGTVVGTISASDVDTGTLLSDWRIVSGNSAGIFSIDAATGEITVTDPTALDFETTNHYDLGITVSDGVNTSATETIAIFVTNTNELPLAVADSLVTDEDSAVVTQNVLNNDDVGDAPISVVSFNAVSDQGGDVIYHGDGTFTYTPPLDFNGVDGFIYTIADASGDVSTTTVSILVNAVNDAPVASADHYVFSEDELLSVDVTHGLLSNDSDVDADTLTALLVGNPASGTVILNPDGSFTYQASPDFNGVDQFIVEIQDGQGGVVQMPVVLEIQPVNDAPAALASQVIFPEDNEYVLQVNDFGFTDIDGDLISGITIDQLPAHGLLTLNGKSIAAGTTVEISEISAGHLRFMPEKDAFGDNYAQLNFKVFDGELFSEAAATLTLNVTAVDDAPVIKTPGKQVASTDAPITFSSETANSFNLDDLDSAQKIQTIVVEVTAGELIIPATSSSGQIEGNRTQRLEISGNIEQLNQALDGLVYQPRAGFVGDVELTMVAGDHGEVIEKITLTFAAPVIPASLDTLSPQASNITDDSGTQDTDKDITTDALSQPALNSGMSAPELASIGKPKTLEIDISAFTRRGVPDAIHDSSSELEPTAINAVGDDLSFNVQVLKVLIDRLNELQAEDSEIDLATLDLSILKDGLDLEPLDEAGLLDFNTGEIVLSGVTVGTILWVLRASGFLSSLLLSYPAWRNVDPLPVLSQVPEDEGPDEDSDEFEPRTKKKPVSTSF